MSFSLTIVVWAQLISTPRSSFICRYKDNDSINIKTTVEKRQDKRTLLLFLYIVLFCDYTTWYYLCLPLPLSICLSYIVKISSMLYFILQNVIHCTLMLVLMFAMMMINMICCVLSNKYILLLLYFIKKKKKEETNVEIGRRDSSCEGETCTFLFLKQMNTSLFFFSISLTSSSSQIIINQLFFIETQIPFRKRNKFEKFSVEKKVSI